MHPRSRNRSNHGFTLIEVLIALSLSLILASLLFSSLHTYALGAAAGQKHLTAKQISESVYQFIGDQLREAVPLALIAGRERNVLFHGDVEQIVYVGQIPSHRAAGGLHKNSLEIDGIAPHQSLIFNYERLIVDEEFDMAAFIETGTSTEKKLIEDARSIEFEYFGVDGDRSDPNWSTEWSINDRLPELIRIRIDRGGNHPRDNIIVPIYANVMSKRVALSIRSFRPTGLTDRFRRRAAAHDQNGTAPSEQVAQ